MPIEFMVLISIDLLDLWFSLVYAYNIFFIIITFINAITIKNYNRPVVFYDFYLHRPIGLYGKA